MRDEATDIHLSPLFQVEKQPRSERQASEASYVVAENAMGFYVFVVGIYGFAVLCQVLLALYRTQGLGQNLIF